MAKSKQGVATAEVLLRNPRAEAFERVARFLQQQGVEVTGRGAAALSIRCAPQLFEQLFRTHLREATAPDRREGVRDFGPARPAGYESEGPAQVPAAIAEEVEGIYLQGPARLF